MGFGIRVQRLWKINLEGCSGPQRKSIIQGSKHTFCTNLGGDALPGIVFGGFGQGFREKVESMGFE